MKSGMLLSIDVTDKKGLIDPKKLSTFIVKADNALFSDCIQQMLRDGFSLPIRELVETITTLESNAEVRSGNFSKNGGANKLKIFCDLLIKQSFYDSHSFAQYYSQLIYLLPPQQQIAAKKIIYACMVSEHEYDRTPSQEISPKLSSYALFVEAVCLHTKQCDLSETDRKLFYMDALCKSLTDSLIHGERTSKSVLLIVEEVVDAYMGAYKKIKLKEHQCVVDCYQNIIGFLTNYTDCIKEQNRNKVLSLVPPLLLETITEEETTKTPSPGQRISFSPEPPEYFDAPEVSEAWIITTYQKTTYQKTTHQKKEPNHVPNQDELCSAPRIPKKETPDSWPLYLGFLMGTGGAVTGFLNSGNNSKNLTSVASVGLMVTGGVLVASHFFSRKRDDQLEKINQREASNQLDCEAGLSTNGTASLEYR